MNPAANIVSAIVGYFWISHSLKKLDMNEALSHA